MINVNKIPTMLYGIELYKNSTEEDLLYILAFIIDNCNYNCNYCYNVRPYTKKTLDLNVLNEYIAYIRNKFPTKYIQLELIGGEPTLHPQIMDFCKKFSNLKNVKLKIFTNLTANIKVYEELLKQKNTILIASWHSLPFDLKNKVFCDKIIELYKSYKDQIETRVMYEKNNTENAILVATELVKYAKHDIFDLSMLFDPKTQNNDLFSYTKQQLEQFAEFHAKNQIRSNRKEFLVQYSDKNIEMKTFSEMFCNKNFSYKRWLCNAGKNSLFIDYDGLVYPCVEYSYAANNSIFNIYSKQFDKCKFKKTLCKLDYCSCDWDIKKEKLFK